MKENPLKASKQKSMGSTKNPGMSSPLKVGKQKTEMSQSTKPVKPKGETSFIVEEMMDHGIAKGDITMSDGTGTDNMTCVLVQFIDPNAQNAEPSSPSDMTKEEQKITS